MVHYGDFLLFSINPSFDQMSSSKLARRTKARALHRSWDGDRQNKFQKLWSFIIGIADRPRHLPFYTIAKHLKGCQGMTAQLIEHPIFKL